MWTACPVSSPSSHHVSSGVHNEGCLTAGMFVPEMDEISSKFVENELIQNRCFRNEAK